MFSSSWVEGPSSTGACMRFAQALPEVWDAVRLHDHLLPDPGLQLLLRVKGLSTLRVHVPI